MYCKFVIASYEALQSLWDCLQVLVLVIVKLDISCLIGLSPEPLVLRGIIQTSEPSFVELRY